MTRASPSSRSASGPLSNLIATDRLRRVSVARYTSPVTPVPSSAAISYGPNLVRKARGIISNSKSVYIRVSDRLIPLINPVFCSEGNSPNGVGKISVGETPKDPRYVVARVGPFTFCRARRTGRLQKLQRRFSKLLNEAPAG